MTSERQVKANRTNARSSTGPRTVRGKIRAAQNARRHGLSLPIHLQPVFTKEVENLAREIAGELACDPRILECAHRVAEAQIDLKRIRLARADLLARDLDDPKADALARDLDDPEYEPELDWRSFKADLKFLKSLAREFGPHTPLPPEIYQPIDHGTKPKPEGAEKFVHILGAFSDQLAAYDRYERRALSRRKFAIRDFDAARAKARRRTRSSGFGKTNPNFS